MDKREYFIRLVGGYFAGERMAFTREQLDKGRVTLFRPNGDQEDYVVTRIRLTSVHDDLTARITMLVSATNPPNMGDVNAAGMFAELSERVKLAVLDSCQGGLTYSDVATEVQDGVTW